MAKAERPLGRVQRGLLQPSNRQFFRRAFKHPDRATSRRPASSTVPVGYERISFVKAEQVVGLPHSPHRQLQPPSVLCGSATKWLHTVKIGVPAPAEHEDETHDQETETKEPTSVDSDELLKKIEATVIAVMNARSNHDTSRVLPRVPAFKSAGPPKVVKRGWQEMESSARLAHQFSSTPRISRLASLLGNPKAPMQLEPQDKDVFGKLFRSGLDDEVNSLPFSNPALLPSTAISSEDEVKALLQHSVDHVGKKRKFKDADEFHRAISIDMRKALDEGPNGSDKVWAYHKYIIFINNLRAARGWSAANDYHWALMEKCQDGEFDFFAGNHFDAQCNEKIQKYALSSPSTKNAKGSGHTRQSRPTTTECSFHGKCNHRTEDCSILKQDPSLKGKKGPHFRT